MKPSTLSLLAAGLVFSSTGLFAETPKPIVSEDFESTPVGEVPKAFTKTGAVGVVDDVAHSGKKSLRMEPATKGGRTITLKGDPLAALGGSFWGRFYYKMKLPAPAPIVPEGKTSGIIHSTMVSGKATSPLANDPIEIRMAGTITRMDGTFRYLFNVQPTGPAKRPEFGATSKAPSEYSADWVLVEWHVDNATQSYHFYVNGEEVKDIAIEKGAGQFAGIEIPPVFDSLTFGWTNYQPAAGEGFTVWIDDLALGKDRLGPVGSGKTAAK